MPRKIIYLAILLLITTALVGCSGVANQAATETAIQVQIDIEKIFQQTVDALAILETEAANNERVSAEETQTAITDETSIAAQASRTARSAVIYAASTRVVEDRLAAINEILQEVGYSTEMGELGWHQSSSKSITISSWNWRRWVPIVRQATYSNFVIHFNATWDTTGLGGCGLIFRAEDDLLNGQQYIFDTIRLSGFPGWRVRLYQYSDMQAYTSGSVKFTNKLDLYNEATNNYILVVDGSTLTVSINGSRISGVTLATRSEGAMAWYAWQLDGRTTCTFTDAWIWELP